MERRVIQLDDPEPSPPDNNCPECKGLGYWIDEHTEDYADDCALCGGTGKVDLVAVGHRTDDWCPVCEAWPRATMAAPPPHDPILYRKCLTCNQVWFDHHDHTPD